ncbi:hypothetical protein CCMA1212_010155 [Trichoderma ghanense]|uniref:Uncharacterized protein n=1 Tax=Trichoderma ghanense TaxID=65468 RepID=A0ABY2GRB2_9HYPO
MAIYGHTSFVDFGKGRSLCGPGSPLDSKYGTAKTQPQIVEFKCKDSNAGHQRALSLGPLP